MHREEKSYCDHGKQLSRDQLSFLGELSLKVKCVEAMH